MMLPWKRDEDAESVLRAGTPGERREAFGRIVEKYGEQLYWKIRNMVLSHEDADDVLQNAFTKAWLSVDTFRGQSKFSTWLFSIAINESLDFIRKQKKRTKAGTPEDPGVAARLMADGYFDGDETQALLRQAVAGLPDVQRTVFNMRYFENMKYAEISKALGTSEGGLKASYHIAVKKITEFFKDRE